MFHVTNSEQFSGKVQSCVYFVCLQGMLIFQGYIFWKIFVVVHLIYPYVRHTDFVQFILYVFYKVVTVWIR